jgi:hypothetical protein
VVRNAGIGNSRGEVTRDPSDPSLAAEQLGREIFERKYSAYFFVGSCHFARASNSLLDGRGDSITKII